MTDKELKLKVAEAIQDDVNKGIVRIDSGYLSEVDIKSGDIVVLREYHPKSKKYTGAEIEFKIGYVLYSDSAGIFGLKEGFCAFSLDALIDIREPGDEDNYE